MPQLGSSSLTVSATARVLRALGNGGEPLAFPEALRGFDALVAPAEDALTEGRRPRILAYAPIAHANRFQSLLYSAAGGCDVGVVPLRYLDELDQLPLFAPFVCHFHWLAGVTAEAPDAAAANAAIDRFLARLDRLIERCGAHIVWTAHNTLPHDTRYAAEHARLRQALIDRCALIHCLTARSRDDLAARFDLGTTPTAVVPHPSYRGAYPDYVTRATARRTLGIAEDAAVLLGLGGLQRYKGFDALCASFEALAGTGEQPWHLVIAGGPSDPALAAELAAWAGGRADVTLHIDKIADDDLQLFLRAADLAVCPYRETLNSGVAALALSFGLPVVASALGAFVALEGEGVMTYDPAVGAPGLAAA
ncbi:MAG: glycosyltransferase family 4 protein, partial [Sphingomonadaceae bacterium]|nr:glycosyltransferase family 4 protein [Sphingomonadaceae bacterium]